MIILKECQGFFDVADQIFMTSPPCQHYMVAPQNNWQSHFIAYLHEILLYICIANSLIDVIMTAYKCKWWFINLLSVGGGKRAWTSPPPTFSGAGYWQVAFFSHETGVPFMQCCIPTPNIFFSVGKQFSSTFYIIAMYPPPKQNKEWSTLNSDPYVVA